MFDWSFSDHCSDAGLGLHSRTSMFDNAAAAANHRHHWLDQGSYDKHFLGQTMLDYPLNCEAKSKENTNNPRWNKLVYKTYMKESLSHLTFRSYVCWHFSVTNAMFPYNMTNQGCLFSSGAPRPVPSSPARVSAHMVAATLACPWTVIYNAFQWRHIKAGVVI